MVLKIATCSPRPGPTCSWWCNILVGSSLQWSFDYVCVCFFFRLSESDDGLKECWLEWWGEWVGERGSVFSIENVGEPLGNFLRLTDCYNKFDTDSVNLFFICARFGSGHFTYSHHGDHLNYYTLGIHSIGTGTLWDQLLVCEWNERVAHRTRTESYLYLWNWYKKVKQRLKTVLVMLMVEKEWLMGISMSGYSEWFDDFNPWTHKLLLRYSWELRKFFFGWFQLVWSWLLVGLNQTRHRNHFFAVIVRVRSTVSHRLKPTPSGDIRSTSVTFTIVMISYHAMSKFTIVPKLIIIL